MSETTQQTGMLTKIERRGEVAVSAMAAKAKAEVEARYVIAMRPENRRDHMQVRAAILDSCKRPKFAEGALYRKPVGGGKTVDGFSIRFAEEALKAMRNIVTDSMIVWEDDEKRCIRISVTDLESNTTYSDDMIIAKTVERRTLKDGQEKLGERLNSYGDKVFIVAATEDDMANKVNAGKSKVIRNSGLRLIPQDILEEAWDQVMETLKKGGSDPKAEIKKVCDAFGALNISPAELERLLGHLIDTISPKELAELRGYYTAIKDGETTWKAVLETAAPKRPKLETDAVATEPTTNPTVQVMTFDEAAKELLANAKRDGVSEDQIVGFCKVKKLCGDKVVDVLQMRESTVKQLATTWPNIVAEIREIQI